MSSFHQLIIEHDEIEQSMIKLVTLVDDHQVPPHTIFVQLQRLNDEISVHVDREDRILAGLDQRELDQRWMSSWKSAAADLDSLRQDWLTFLETWNDRMIGDQRSEFQEAMIVMVRDLSERVRFETETFYAAALQTGVITLR